MSACDRWVNLKLVELVLCVICLLYKKWSDEEASRLFYLNEKASAEWPLLKKVTWGDGGSLFADVTYGSYGIITFALLIGYCVGELQHSQRMETILMGLGALLFIGVGCLEIGGIDMLQHELMDNAVILGILSILTGLIFLFDIGTIPKRNKQKPARYQTQNIRIAQEKMSQQKDGTLAAEKPGDMTRVETGNVPKEQINGTLMTNDTTKLVQNQQRKDKTPKDKSKNQKVKEKPKADIVISGPIPVANYANGGATMPVDQPDYESTNAVSRAPTRPVYGYPMAGMVPIGELRSSLRKRQEMREGSRTQNAASDDNTIVEMDLRKIDGSDIPHRMSAVSEAEVSDKDHTQSSYYDSKEKAQLFTRIISGTDHPRNSNIGYTEDKLIHSDVRNLPNSKQSYESYRDKDIYFLQQPPAFGGLTREKRQLSKSLDDTHIDVRLQSPTITSSRKTPTRRSPESSDESVLNLQLPSVSYILTDRGKKVMPIVSQSPIERVSEQREITPSQKTKETYYYGNLKEMDLKESDDDVLHDSPRSPRDPGYVLHTASNWPTAKPADSGSKFRWSQNAKTRNMRGTSDELT